MLSTQERQRLREQIISNRHEVFVVSFKEMDAIVRSSPKRNSPQIKEIWAKIREEVEFGASYYASADDVRTLAKLVSDLGGVGVKAYVKNYRGKPHIILKGYPGLRRVLTGTRYGIFNPKVVKMGLGKAGAINSARLGGIITVYFMTGYRIADYFLTDRVTLNRLVGSLATDVVKIGITTGASIAGATTGAAIFTIAAAPLIGVVIVGTITSLGLTYLDNKYEITEDVITGLDNLEAKLNSKIKGMHRDIQKSIDKTADSTIDYVIDTATRIIIDTAKHRLDDFLLARPRLY